MTSVRTDWLRLAVIWLVVGTVGGCRFDGPGPSAGSLEYRLVHKSWSSFSEIFSSNRGYRVAFLPFNIVARESGRLSESWRVVDDDILEFANGFDRRFRYRWFESAHLFAFCREGFPKPFFLAPDNLSPAKVFELARMAELDTCGPMTVLRIAGARIVRSEERPDLVQMIDLSNLDLSRQVRAALKDVGTLETLLLSRSDLSDRNLGYIARLSSLTNLSLEGNPITDAGITYLMDLPLVGLDLSSTEITDHGIIQLGGIPTLRVLYVSNTAVTPQGVDSLMSMLPDLSVQR